jgi:uncharacterized protein YbaR (Trm112 family)
MHPSLLEILVCPACRGDLSLVEGSASEKIERGTLSCTCGKQYPIRAGVPCLLLDDAPRADFEGQWEARLDGRFEGPGLLYAMEPSSLITWLVDHCLQGLKPNTWLIDAGCGSAEKAALLARRHPDVNVLGVDLSPTLTRSAKRFAEIPNLHLVNANLLSLPIREKSIDAIISWGVIHHTPDTHKAFTELARSLAPTGRVVIWLYPDPDEDPMWRPLYWIRDKVFFERGYQLPKRLQIALSHATTLALAVPLAAFYWTKLQPRFSAIPYMSTRALGLKQQYDAAVFLVHDAIAPQYQDRPPRALIHRWFQDAGLGAPNEDGDGHFWATRPS